MATAGIVLCGGQSSRMGRAKAWLPWQGRPMVAHVVGILRQVVDEVVVVAAKGQALPDLDAIVVEDRASALGPLAGIREGLEAISAPRAFVCSTDSPYLTPGFVAALLARPGAAALEQGGFVQVLAAVYPKDGALQAAELIAAGRMRPLHLLEAVGYEKLLPRDVPDVASARGFNTPDAYLEGVRRESPEAMARVERVDPGGSSALVEVPVGTLAEVLSHSDLTRACLVGEALSPDVRISLETGFALTEVGVPIGPGEHVIVRSSH